MMTIQEVLGALCQGNVRGMRMTTSVETRLWIHIPPCAYVLAATRLPTKGGQGKAEETDVEAKKGVDSAATYSLQKWQVKISHSSATYQQVNQNTASKPPPQYNTFTRCAHILILRSKCSICGPPASDDEGIL